MKRNFKSFITGMLVALLLSGGTITAMAADGLLNLTVYPTRIMVDGQIFQPTDSSGKPVLVFSYNGTTYAPVKALAEAYGLQVGYDPGKGLFTVNGSAAHKSVNSTAAFADSWTVTPKTNSGKESEKIFNAAYAGSLSIEQFKAWWKAQDIEVIKREAAQMAKSAALSSGKTVLMYFSYNGYNLGNALASGEYANANFEIADAWIK